MNLFKKYGIKEVADVTFYSIIEIGDEEIYIPVLTLDTLKISTLNQKSTAVTARGGYADQKILAWNFGKDITLTLEDALFSAASMSLTYGWLNSQLSVITSLIAKINIANKFGKLNYSIYAYPSPELTEEEWEMVFFVLSRVHTGLDTILCENVRIYYGNRYIEKDIAPYVTQDFINEEYVSEFRYKVKSSYKNRSLYRAVDKDKELYKAMPKKIIQLLFNQIKKVSDYYKIDTDNFELEVIDRMEGCVVTQDNGLNIDFQQQWENLQAYFNNDKTHSYTIFYDAKTMQPLVANYDGDIAKRGIATLKKGTPYYKWTRTVQQKIDDRDFLGKVLTINADRFPQKFKIVGETYIREQKTNKDSRYQFIINRAQISTDTNITLQADGEPTTFSMNIDVLTPPNEVMVELRQFDVVNDEEYGGSKVLPQETEYTRTRMYTEQEEVEDVENNEIY